ncbi:MAG: hypothetical protein R3D26_09535 [Cyanobacteriota/Melainabacteria group bacterium]
MKIFLHLVLIGLVLSLMSTAPAISYEFDEELPPDVTYQVLNATLEAAKAKGVGTSSYEKHIQSIEKDDSLNARQKQIALNDIYDALKQQLKLSRRSTIGDGAWSNFSHALSRADADLSNSARVGICFECYLCIAPRRKRFESQAAQFIGYQQIGL